MQSLVSCIDLNFIIFRLFLGYFAAETGIVFNLFLKWSKNEIRVPKKLFVQKECIATFVY